MQTGPAAGDVKRRLLHLLVAVASIGIGLLFRAPGLGLPREVAKYGGSIRWAAMVYFGRMIAPGLPSGSSRWWPPCWPYLVRQRS
jgi:hypothetical protein